MRVPSFTSGSEALDDPQLPPVLLSAMRFRERLWGLGALLAQGCLPEIHLASDASIDTPLTNTDIAPHDHDTGDASVADRDLRDDIRSPSTDLSADLPEAALADVLPQGGEDVSSDRPPMTAEDASLDAVAVDAATCGASLTLCDGRCVTISNDIQNCGQCARVCSSRRGTPSCVSGVCRIQCGDGYGDCDGDESNGCETTLDTTDHCGACSVQCAQRAGETVRCVSGRCQRECGVGTTLVGDACVPIPVPRQIGPLSGQYLTGRTPTLRWQVTRPADGADVELCRDRVCSVVVRRIATTGTSVTVTPPLDRGTWFWRLRARAGQVMGGSVSPVWQFVVVGDALRTVAYGAQPDFDGDGTNDLVVSASGVAPRGAVYRYTGRVGVTTAPQQVLRSTVGADLFFGHATGVAGDVNGDGYLDLVTCSFASAQYRGACYLYHGSPAGLSQTSQTTVQGGLIGNLGWSVTGVGDFDGDGYADIAIGSPNVDMETGRVQLHRGSPMGLLPSPTFTLTGPAANSGIGFSVSAGDLDGDGRAELIAGGNRAESNRGAVLLLAGSATPDTGQAVRLYPPNGGQFGYAVQVAGDLNGDGYPDLVVGAPFAPSGGEVYVFLGGATGVGTRPDFVLLPGGQLGPSAGLALAAPGDIDGDGLVELGVGAPLSGTTDVPLTGSVGIFAGTQGGPPRLVWSLAGPTGANALFGISLSMASDLNGDGRRDLVVGTGQEAGRAAQVLIFPALVDGMPGRSGMLLNAPDTGSVGFGRFFAQ